MLAPAHARLLDEGARQLGVSLSDADIARFALYIEELLRWSKMADLVAQTDPVLLIRKHFLDSLAIAPLMPPAGRVLDLGSGAGFPGLVLAIIAPTLQVTLVESRRKRANFLKTVSRTMNLSQVRVYEGRAEVLAHTPPLSASFDMVVTRATWPLAALLSLAAPFLPANGQVLAMKGPKVEQELADLGKNLMHDARWALRRRYVYSLPFGKEKREAVIFDKLSI